MRESWYAGPMVLPRSRGRAAALLGLSVAVGLILFALQVISFPRDTQVTVDYIIRSEGRFFLLVFGPAVAMTLLVQRGSPLGRILAIAMAPPYLLGLWQIVDPNGYGWVGHEAEWMGVVRPVLALVAFCLYLAGLCILPKDGRDGHAIWAGPLLVGLGWLAIEHGMLIGAGRDESDPLWVGAQITAANMEAVADTLHAYSVALAVITCGLALVRDQRAATIALALPYLVVLVFTSMNTPFDLAQYGATLVGPDEPPWYAPVYWTSCATMFIALLVSQPIGLSFTWRRRGDAARREAQRRMR
ncbi:hypothetical protein ETD86_00455 [Nonomuraea turkmeniaca]|uniref:Uncharacterized protein n=1 Tax=Nonomuraea turkmeniaca TaxID=103838 RepID=A0A5S4FYH0_9ACTN|nr:hypothetical protein [Nonomuraea turkmeniaca]TMR25632.1 hypothetical protein ETD86_00455 [Nonomuraea turkmeniaca]